MLESIKKEKANEDLFLGTLKAISEIRNQVDCYSSLDVVIWRFGYELWALEKGRSPREEVTKRLDQMVDLIEETDLVFKKYTSTKVQVRELLVKHKAVLKKMSDELQCASLESCYRNGFSFFQEKRSLEMFATFHSIANAKK